MTDRFDRPAEVGAVANSDGSNARRRLRRLLASAIADVRSPCAIGLIIVFVVISAFYFWTGTSSGNPIHIGGPENDTTVNYNELADGFLHGHLSLPMQPPKSLLDSPNPYSPPCCDLVIWDSSLYHGKFYLPYGPAPALALYIPWRILQLGPIPDNLAVILMAIAAFGGALLCLSFLVRRFLPGTATWKIVTAGTMLGLGLDLAFMLRNPSIYEASVTGGIWFTTWGLYYLGTGALDGRPVKWRLALGSLSIGLAWGSHADLALLGLLVLATFVMLWRRSRGEAHGDRLRVAAAVLAPFVLVGMLLAAYNYARFASVTQTGENYDVGCNCLHSPQFRSDALLEGSYEYFVAPARFSLAFPYFELPPPPYYPGTPLPDNIQEPVGGILAVAPITLDLIALPLLLRRRKSRELGVICLAFVAMGIAVWFGVSSVGAVAVRYTQRLEADFAPLLLLPALAVWMAIAGRQVLRRALTALGVVLIVYGCLVGVAISVVGYYNGLYVSAPTTYRNLQSATSAFPTLVTMLLGKPYISAIGSPGGVTSYYNNYTTPGVGEALAFSLSPAASEIDIISPSGGTYDFVASFERAPGASKSRIELSIAYGSHRVATGFRAGARAIPLDLKMGLNRIDVTARPLFGSAPQQGTAEVTVTSVSLTRGTHLLRE